MSCNSCPSNYYSQEQDLQPEFLSQNPSFMESHGGQAYSNVNDPQLFRSVDQWDPHDPYNMNNNAHSPVLNAYEMQTKEDMCHSVGHGMVQLPKPQTPSDICYDPDIPGNQVDPQPQYLPDTYYNPSHPAHHPIQSPATVVPCQRCPNANGTLLDKAVEDTLKRKQLMYNTTVQAQRCDVNPKPCNNKIEWQGKFKGCGATYTTDRCMIAPKGDRYYIADLRPLIAARAMEDGRKWNPYKYFHGRQMLSQFLWKNVRDPSDPYTKRLDNLDESFCLQQKVRGPPQYTNF